MFHDPDSKSFMKNSKNMDGEPNRIEEKTEEDSYDQFPNTGNFLQSTWLRCAVRARDEMDRLILDNRRHILFHFNPILYVILLFLKR
jgi:hypothetical protein